MSILKCVPEYDILSGNICLNTYKKTLNPNNYGSFFKVYSPKDAAPLLHSDQGWQYQMKEYRRMLKEHNVTQSMSRKGNCLDNSCMENFFGRLKVEMFFGEKFESVNAFIDKLEEYIYYYNNKRISLKLKGMSPVQYRTHYQIIN